MTKDHDRSETEEELLEWLSGFHSWALIAYVEQWREDGVFQPDSEKTRQRAYRYHKEEQKRDDAQRRS